MEVIEYQKKIMRHAISGPHRDWFGTYLACKDSAEFERLVRLGFAKGEKKG